MPRKRCEATEQEAVISWAEYNEYQYPSLKWLYAIPNGGSRHPYEAVNLKRQGVKAGVSDLKVPCMRGGFGGLYIEMKYGDNKLTEKQAEFLEDMQKEGYKTAVCYTADEAIEVIEKYLKL